MKVTSSLAQIYITVIYLVGITFNIAMIFSSEASGRIFDDQVIIMLKSVFAAYAPPLSIIAGGYFSFKTMEIRLVSKNVFWVAVSFSLLWNIILMWRAFSFATSESDHIDNFINHFNEIAPAGMFLVAGVLTFFFANKEQNEIEQ